jgi:hypothetical protein
MKIDLLWKKLQLFSILQLVIKCYQLENVLYSICLLIRQNQYNNTCFRHQKKTTDLMSEDILMPDYVE